MNEVFMREAIQLSMDQMSMGLGGPFGAVVVRGSEIIGRGWNEVVPRRDPTAHAEVQAIRQACQRLGSHQLAGCEIYTSCEPCPMCLGAIYWSRLERIWYAATRDDAAQAGFDDDFIYRELVLPLGARRLRAVQALRDEALAAFGAWDRKVDKIRY
jgi:tRNA(Arg) A34 adenosine deaminase TadA